MLRSLRRFSSVCYPPVPGESHIRKIGVIQGDGIGPQVCRAASDVLHHVKAPIQLIPISETNFDDSGLISYLRSLDSIIKGTIDHPVAQGQQSPNLKLRKKLDVYADVVHALTIPGIKTRHQNIDIIVIRQNLQGEYSGLQHQVYPGVVQSIKVITSAGSKRISDYAFELAFLNNRKKVTAVHKANIMKKVDGEFLKAVRSTAARYNSINLHEMIIDNACMQMTSNPQQFDVVILPNLYGSIIANIITFLVGGPGVTAGVNIGKDIAIFQQGTRHGAQQISGKNIANPTAMILSSSMMLRYLNLPHFADRIQNALFKTIKEGKVTTIDIGGTASTFQFTQEVANNIIFQVT